MQVLNSFIERLISLKRKLNNQNMSLLAGAGLSKNISLLFPSWYELLSDMAKEMFEAEIETEYLLVKKSSGRRTKTDSYDNYLANKLAYKIESLGYLKIVSEYVRRKGYRETVETYIEDRIPKISIEDGLPYLSIRNNRRQLREQLPENKLELHRRLFQLPWNNVYTTNYDNAIEVSIDEHIKERLQEKISELQNSIEQLERTLATNKTEEELLRNKLAAIQRAKEAQMFRKASDLKADYSLDDVDDSVAVNEINSIENEQDLRSKIFNFEHTIEYTQTKIKENSETIERLQGLLNDCFTVVVHSSQLSIKRNKNVIKLHGSLRETGDSRGYGFDNDLRKHYVISEEDYETYPQKHEAFTQLMRISLLQESFCLVGFSGIDPNFLAWIGWVRDIIHRNSGAALNDEKDDKIYLIETSSVFPSPDKQLFYTNHRIGHIPILHPECILFLEKQTGITVKDRSSKTEVLLLLAEFLNDGLHISKPKAALELLENDLYKKKWAELPIHDYSKIDLAGLLESAKGLKDSRGNIRLPNLNFAYSHSKHSLLHFIRAFAAKANTETERVGLFELIVIALKDQLLPYSIYNDENIIDQLSEKINDKELLSEFRLLQLKDAVWRGDETRFNTLARGFKPSSEPTKQEFIYQKILLATITLDFSTAKNSVYHWHATGPWILKKAGLLAMFDLEQAIKLLAESSQDSLQDQLYHYHLLAYFLRGKDWKRDKHIREKIKVLEAEGLKTIEENTDYLLKEVNKSNNDITPYGKDKFSVGRGITLSNTDVRLQSFQYFNVLLESGFPLVISRVHFDSHKQTYALIKNCLRYYPFITVYMALQYSNHDFLKRLGQDCAYSDALQNDILQISANLQQAYFSIHTPEHFRESILVFYSELIIALKPEKWQQFFMKVWAHFHAMGRLFADLRRANNDFILNGLRYVKQPEALEKVIDHCLENLNKESGKTSIHYLYQVAQNYWFEKKAVSVKSSGLRRRINKVIHQISGDVSTAIFLLGNIEPLLSASNRKAIQAKLAIADLKSVDNARVWHVILFFANGDKAIVKKVKEAIMNHPKLWNTGITEGGGSYPFEYVSLYKLRKTNDRRGISWTDREKEKIFERMLPELEKIEAFINRRTDVTGYESVLEEMLYFLEDEIPTGDNRDKVLKQVRSVYERQKGYGEILDGLLADERQKVIWSLNEVAKLIYQYEKIGDNFRFVTMVINKLLLKSQPGLEACLHYVSAWLFDFREEVNMASSAELVLKIVEMYHTNPPDDIEKPFLEATLIKMAYVLKSWKVKSPMINKILANRKNSRFQNLLYDLKDVPSDTK
jgi:hypothetical protein